MKKNEILKDYEITEEVKTLYPNYDHAKSFYNKAHLKIYNVIKYNNDYMCDFKSMLKIELYSYNTLVLTIYKDIKEHKNDAYSLYDGVFYSNTTMRHIKECLKQYYFNKDISIKLINNNYSKKEIFKHNVSSFLAFCNNEVMQ